MRKTFYYSKTYFGFMVVQLRENYEMFANNLFSTIKNNMSSNYDANGLIYK